MMEKAYFCMHFNLGAQLLTEPLAYSSNEWISEPQQIGPDFHFFANGEGLNDYLVNNANLPLMSERMKTLMAGASGAEKATWYKVDVIDRKGRAWPYYIPFFREAGEVLNRGASEVSDGILVKAVFDAEKLDGLDFFPVEPGVEIRLIVSRTIKDMLEKANMTGLGFTPVTVR